MKAAWFDVLVFDPRFGGQNCLSVAQALQFFFARRPIGSCNLVLFVHHRLMRGEKSVHDSRIGAKPFVHCET